jgi:hypothetical protein
MLAKKIKTDGREALLSSLIDLRLYVNRSDKYLLRYLTAVAWHPCKL